MRGDARKILRVEFNALRDLEKRGVSLQKTMLRKRESAAMKSAELDSVSLRVKKVARVSAGHRRQYGACNSACRGALMAALGIAALLSAGCRRRSPEQNKVSAVSVLSERAGPIVTRLPGAEYDIWPSGYVQAYQIQKRTSRRLSIEQQEAGDPAWGDKLWVDGKEVTDFVYDFRSLKTTDVRNKIGKLGKRVEVKARSKAKQIEKT